MDASQMEAILAKLSTIENTVSDVKSDVQQLKGDVQQLKGDVQQLKGDVQQLKGDVCALNKEMSLVARIAYTTCATTSNIYNDPFALGAVINHLNEQQWAC